MKKISILVVSLSFFFAREIKAQDSSLRQQAPHVFIDCKAGCDMNFLKAQLNYINHVMDMRLADVYIMITATGTGGGGTQINLFVTNEKTMHVDTLQYLLPPNSSDGISRDMMLKKIKSIILPYIAASPLADYVDYNMTLPKKDTDSKGVKDKWNFWTGQLGLRGNVSDVGYRKEYNANTSLNLQRITDKSRFDVMGNFQYNYVWATNNGQVSTGQRTSYGGFMRKAFSIGNHFAAGYFASFTSSSVTNMKSNTTFFPAFEYNVFPYSKATRRFLRMLYRAGARYQEYFTTTVLNKNNMMLFPHSFIIDYIQIEKWGTLDITTGATHYFNYSHNYNVSLIPSITLNPFKGFVFSLSCAYTLVNDQFFLRQGSVSDSQVLLGQVQLKTASTFTAFVGLRYNFGSIYSNVVNVRFDMDQQFW